MVTRYHFGRRSGKDNVPTEYECRILDHRQSIKTIFLKVGLLTEPGRSIRVHYGHYFPEAERVRNSGIAKHCIVPYWKAMKAWSILSTGINRIRFLNENLIRQIGVNATGAYCYTALHQRKSPCLWCVAEQVFKGNRVRFEMQNPGIRSGTIASMCRCGYPTGRCTANP